MEKEIERALEALKALKIGGEIVIRDDSQVIPGKNRTGGAYSYRLHIRRVGEDNYILSYHTSADFPFCAVDGQFQDCPCDKGQECPQHLSLDRRGAEEEIEMVGTLFGPLQEITSVEVKGDGDE